MCQLHVRAISQPLFVVTIPPKQSDEEIMNEKMHHIIDAMISSSSSSSLFVVILPCYLFAIASSFQTVPLMLRSNSNCSWRSKMNRELAQIRREKWLQHQSKEIQQSPEESSSSSSNRMPLLSSSCSSTSTAKKSNNQSQNNFSNQKKDTTLNDDSDDIVILNQDVDDVIEIMTPPRKKNKPNSTSGKEKRIERASSNDAIDLTLASDDEEEEDSNAKKSNDSSNNQLKSEWVSKKKNSVNKMNASRSFKKSSLSSPLLAKQSIPTFSICSYNIWFHPTQHESKRMNEISNLISNYGDHKPLFIGLQEVTLGLLHELEPLLSSMGYKIIAQSTCYQGGAYGVAIAVLTQPPSTDHMLQVQIVKTGFDSYQQTMQGRGLLWVDASITHQISSSSSSSSPLQTRQSYRVLFTTTHLESFISKQDNGSRSRVSQIKQVVQFCQNYHCKQHNHDAIDATFITGDLNWDDERKRSKGDDELLVSITNSIPCNNNNSNNNNNNKNVWEWKDAWKVCHPKEDGYTYDSKISPMLKGNLRRRFDRCLYFVGANILDDIDSRSNDAGPNFAPLDAALIGTKAIEGVMWKKEVQKWMYGKPTGEMSIDPRPLTPSDHFGLFVQFGDSSS